MNFFRRHRKSFGLLWIVLLSTTILCTQNLQFHVHSLDHGTDQHDDHGAAVMDKGHGHVSIAHLSIDTSHADHHEALMFEMDASPDSIFSQLPNSGSPMDLLILLLVLFTLSAFIFYKPGTRRALDSFVPKRRFHLTPRLRAPPC